MQTGASDKKAVRVTVCNQSFTVVTSGDPAEVIQLAQMVDELIAGIASRSGNIDPGRLAILACLHLADRVHSLEQEMNSLRERVAAKTEHFRSLLDQVVE